MNACALDANLVLSALAGDWPHEVGDDDRARIVAHIDGCEACADLARMHQRARRAWRTVIEHDDVEGRAHRERRLLHARPQKRAAFGGAIHLVIGAMLGGVIVAAGLGAFERGAPRMARGPTLETEARGAAPTATVAEVGSTPLAARALAAPSRAGGTERSAARGSNEAFLAAHACASCTRGGERLPEDAPLDARPVQVPRGSTLLVAFIAGEPGGAAIVDTRSGVDVTGPARLHLAGGAIMLDGGTALADAREMGIAQVVRTPSARTTGSNAAWRVEVDGDTTRIDVLRGEVALEGPGAPSRTLRAGEHVVLRPLAPSAAGAARAGAEGSDHATAAAPGALRAPAAESSEPSDAGDAKNPEKPFANSRAALDAAVAALAAGSVEYAFERLHALFDARDESVAFDAASALASASPKNRDRAGVWRLYLSRERPRPYADVAMGELANVLLDLADDVGASVVVGALSQRPAAPEAAILLERARARLASNSAEECLGHDVHKLRRASR